MEKYDPIRVIGEGSFGKVYLMRDKVNRKFVCVKVIKIKNIPKKEREATRMEVDLLKRLHHPNIVRYVDSFLSKNRESLCIAMEYCDGGDLASQVKSARRNLFSEDKILHWFVQITLGLHYMHSSKVLHRDLKTQNIFLLGNGRLVLGDLGISKVLEGTMDFAQTCIGTPYYMSPEIFKNKPYSYKSDIWALGCVLYEMTTLNHAFDAQSLNGLAQKIIKGSYPPIHHRYSRHLKELIGEMLSANPTQRPDTDQILSKPFIKKHIVNFFTDIASRPSQSLGEGTMIVRAAGGGPLDKFGGDVNMVSFRKQLHDIGLDDAIQKALSAKDDIRAVAPADAGEAKKLAREASSALKREEEHKKIVEAALEKLRLERINRAKDRERLIKQQREQQQQQELHRQRYGSNAQPQRQKLIVGGGIAIGGGGHRYRKSNRAAVPYQQASSRRNEPLSARDRNANPRDARGDVRRPLVEPERRRQVEDSGQRQGEGRRALAAEQERRRQAEEAAAAAEAARVAKEAREREEAAAKQHRDQLRAQQDAVQRREQQLYLERERQRAAVEQLNRDKIELDRRLAEKDRRREEKVREEKQRLDNARAEQLQYYKTPPAEDKSSDRGRDHKQDAQFYDAVRAEAEARVRHSHAPHQPVAYGKDAKDSEPVSGRRGGYEFESAETRNKPSRQLTVDELADKLNDVSNKARFEVNGSGSGNAYADNSSDMDEDDEIDDETEDGVFDDNELADEVEEEEDLKNKEEELKAELNMATKRVSDLKATLECTKSFYDQYSAGGKTNHAGGTTINKAQKAGGAGAKGLGPIASTIDSDEDEEDDEYEIESDEEEEEEGQELPSYSVNVPHNDGRVGVRPSHNNGMAVGAPPVLNNIPGAPLVREYSNLQDPPSPSGKLSDRIFRLRQKCIENFGRDHFDEAYRFIRAHAEDDNGDERYHEERIIGVKRIVGEYKAKYVPLIEQLIFMEDTNNN